MPRPKKTADGPTAIVASAARVIAGRRKNRPAGAASWQAEAWDMLDSVGELEFYRRWVANALSMCTLAVVEDQGDEEGDVPATDPTAVAAMAALFGGEAGQPEMLAAMGGHLAVPGETWLVGLTEPPADPSIDMWRVVSHTEVREQGTKWQIDRGDGEPELYDADQVYVTRIWSPHPKKWVEANSSVRSALPILRELVGLSKHVAATIDSRLAGAGILAVPSEITFVSPVAPDGDPEDPEQDPFMAALIEAMLTAIEDRADASAYVPIVVKAAAEHLDKIRHITFSTPLDDKAKDLRQEAIGRLANSLDVPAEVLTGMADVNHWTGWLLDENAIKMHVEPLLSVITHGLTTRYLWPCLQGQAPALDPALRRFKIVGSTAALRQRPNRSAEATAAHDSITITDKAWAREVGFQDDDLIDPLSDEFRRRILMLLAKSSVPEVVVGALAALGVDVSLPVLPVPKPVVDVPSDAQENPVQIAAPATPASTTDTHSPPALDAPVTASGAGQEAALLAVSEALVARAVERAWNRSGKRGRTRVAVPDADLAAAFQGAWDGVPRAAALTGVDPDRLTAALNRYAAGLLTLGGNLYPAALTAVLRDEVLTDT